jgi:hypothetical protein
MSALGGMMVFVPTTLTAPTADLTVHTRSPYELWRAAQTVPAPEPSAYQGRHRRPAEVAEHNR